MSILNVYNVNKSFGTSEILKDVSFSVNKGDKLAIVGDNGEGKTTLLKILTKELEPDSGTVSFENGTSYGYLSQKVITSVDNTLLEEMRLSFKNLISMEDEMNQLIKKMENSTDEKLIHRYSELQDKYQINGGYEYQYQIKQMLFAFGFDSTYYDRKIESFSGGERTRAAFVKLLLNKPTLLLLDEPTNHLDLIMIEWLEKFLKSYAGTIVIVSHDQLFIDNLATKILEIENHKATLYTGNYTSYANQKKELYESKLRAYNIQEKEIKRYEMLIQKFRTKSPKKAKFVNSLETRLEHMDRIDKPNQKKKTIKASIDSNLDPFDVKVHICEDLLFGYDNIPLTEPLNLVIRNQDKICIMGQNGSGKTTLLKTMMNNSFKISGTNMDVRPNLKYFYFDQTQQILNDSLNLFDTIGNEFPLMDNTQIRNVLGRFLFSDDDVFKMVSDLSGGERIRLIFALISLRKYDILYLDEPTNHLDFSTKSVISDILEDYPGTIIMVSHDRYFVNRIATKIVYFYNKKFIIENGNYNDFISLHDLSNDAFTALLSKKNESTKEKEKTVKPVRIDNKKEKKKLETLLDEKMKDLEELSSKINDPEAEYDWVEYRKMQEDVENLELEVEDLMKKLDDFD